MQLDLPEDLTDSLTTLAQILDTNVQTLVLYAVQTYLYTLRSPEHMKNPEVAAAFEQWRSSVGKALASSKILKTH